MDSIRTLIAEVPDFPKPGILFYDVTPVLLDAAASQALTDELCARAKQRGANKIAGIESRGFIFGTPVAQQLGLGFLPMRKPGKLPRKTRKASFEKEYGEDVIEIHEEDCGPGDKVLIVDDLLATGGTAAAARDLVEASGAEVAGFLFVVELSALGGRDKLGELPVDALLVY